MEETLIKTIGAGFTNIRSTQNSDLEERHKELFLREELIEEGVLLLLDEEKVLPIEQN